MINGGFLGAGGELNRDNNYILDHVDRLKEIPVHIVHGRYAAGGRAQRPRGASAIRTAPLRS